MELKSSDDVAKVPSSWDKDGKAGTDYRARLSMGCVYVCMCVGKGVSIGHLNLGHLRRETQCPGTG